MSDVKCVKCGEPWDYYGLHHGDMLSWEKDLFLKGAGCPCCKGEPEEPWEPQGIEDVELGDEDPMLRIIALESAQAGTAPKWERPEDPILWKCDGCGVEVIRDLDTGNLEYQLPAKAKGSQWYNSHQYHKGRPEETPAHIFGDRKVCEFCLAHCADCGKPITSLLDFDDVYDEGCSMPDRSDSYSSGLCVDCYSVRCDFCGSRPEDCDCGKDD